MTVNILLFNNQIYGLTKGQYSPTSEEGKVTKSTPVRLSGSPLQPDRTRPRRRGRPSSHGPSTPIATTGPKSCARPPPTEGSAFIEIYQNCNVFNDGAFDAVRGKAKDANHIRLVDGEPIRFGADGERGVFRGRDGRLQVADVTEVGEDALVVHDADDPTHAYALARLADRPSGPTPLGVLRSSDRPTYAEGMGEELAAAREGVGDDDLTALLRSGDTWTIE